MGGGNIIENNYYSQEIAAGAYTDVQHGCAIDWAYISRGMHALMPEGMAIGKDYDGDRYVTVHEILRWNDEDKEGEFWGHWESFQHPTLGVVEIGGPLGIPPALDERMREESNLHYRFLLHIADLAPVLKIADLSAERIAEGEYRVVARLQNQGYLATYVSRKALEIRRDNPILARLEIDTGEVLGGGALQNAGHILGKHSYLWRWGAGADESTKTVEWRVRAESGAEVSIEVRAAQAGRDRRTIILEG